MENIHLENIDFEYETGNKIFSGADIDISAGELVLVCGKTGCGKSTLLRIIQKELGTKTGFVMQNPDNQIVCDKVYAELEFGVANQTDGQGKIHSRLVRQRVAETVGYFGISHQLDRDTDTLSGGEKQVLNIASVMAANPQVLILDEPTSMLDPIMADRVIDLVKNINRELGVTVIIAEHRSDRLFAYADKVILIENSKTICKTNRDMAAYMWNKDELAGFLPEITRDVNVSMLSFSSSQAVDTSMLPLSLSEAVNISNVSDLPSKYGEYGRNYFPNRTESKNASKGKAVLQLRNVAFSYAKDKAPVIDNLTLSIDSHSITALLGENGCGKSTLALLAAGALKPYSGKVKIDGKKIKKAGENCAMLFQDVTCHFTEDMLGGKYAGRHPYDLSGGEKQLAALDIILAKNPALLILDEPTKGLDYNEKMKLADKLGSLREKGKAILLITHDVEFAALTSDRMLLMFGGGIVSDKPPQEFCESNIFYTTAAARLGNMMKES